MKVFNYELSQKRKKITSNYHAEKRGRKNCIRAITLHDSTPRIRSCGPSERAHGPKTQTGGVTSCEVWLQLLCSAWEEQRSEQPAGRPGLLCITSHTQALRFTPGQKYTSAPPLPLHPFFMLQKPSHFPR